MTDPSVLDTARTALAQERSQRSRGVDVRVDAVREAGEGLWALDVTTDQPLDARRLVGGTLARPLLNGGGAAPFSALVVEVDADEDVLYVEAGPKHPPTPGRAVVWPYDFLDPLRRLLAPEGAGGHVALAQALVEARTPAAPREVGGPAGLAAPWRHANVSVWGPPGTGKTFTIAREVATLLSDPSERVLLVSTTNKATDDLALRLGVRLRERGTTHGLVRVGRVVRARPFVDAGLQEVLPDPDPAWADELDALQDALDGASPDARSDVLRRIARLIGRRPGFVVRALDDRHRVVVATLHGALRGLSSPELLAAVTRGPRPFTTVVLDEAGLVSRLPAAALALLASRRVVRVGDPQQLSPISSAARSMHPDERTWLASSPLLHLTQTVDRPDVQRLRMQHRMHADIRAAVSALAYEGTLSDAPALASRVMPDAAIRLLPRALWYVLDEHTEHRAELHAARAPGGSRVRPLLRSVLTALVAAIPGLRSQRGLVVTPYRGQVALASEVLRELDLGTWRASTVHAQQGSEADVVVFDTVHASSTGWSPSEWIRLVNVGLSRARHLVIVVASRAELDQPQLRVLRRHLVPRVLRRGAWVSVDAVGEDTSSLFRRPAPAPLAAEPPAGWPGDDAPLGDHLGALRRLRPRLSHEQARLVHRDLSDAGPRLVRGVAGSGKSLVLAHWVVRALRGLGVPEVTVVYGNEALRPLLTRMIADVWDAETGGAPALSWDRVVLKHVGELLRALRTEAGLPPAADDERWDYEAQARSVRQAGALPPRFAALFLDEAQDLGHDTLGLLVSLVLPGGDGKRAVLVFYDNAQNVYGRQPPVWKELGLDLRGRSDVMRESFRTTRPITELALDVLDRLWPLESDPDFRELMVARPGEETALWKDAEGWHAPFCVVEGRAPAVRLVDTADEELALVVGQVQRWLGRDRVSPGDIRVIAMGRVREAVVDALRRAGLPVTERTTQGFEDCATQVVVTTPQSFKGHDAELVIVVGADRFRANGSPLASALYVALTRARTLLVVTAVRGRGDDAVTAALEAAAARWTTAAAP